MCLYPRLILNKKYLPNSKNKYNPPTIKDERTRYVPIGCGKCMECMKQNARQWQVRLHEELRTGGNVYFVTLSFSDKSLYELETEYIEQRTAEIISLQDQGENPSDELPQGYELDNIIATLATRRFLERWRKQFKRSVKHWFVTELGSKNTERIHIHGLIWCNIADKIGDIWKYGNVWIGSYVNEKTINYIVKYIYKTDNKHKYYKPKVLTSPGIGSNYIKRPDSKLNKFKGEDTNETYITRSRLKLPLPIYYRNKIYTEEEKEELWLNLLDKEKRYVNGIEVDVSENENDYWKLLKQHRKLNKILGYNDDSEDWDRKKYEQQLRNLKRLQRIEKNKKKK